MLVLSKFKIANVVGAMRSQPTPMHLLGVCVAAAPPWGNRILGHHLVRVRPLAIRLALNPPPTSGTYADVNTVESHIGRNLEFAVSHPLSNPFFLVVSVTQKFVARHAARGRDERGPRLQSIGRY